MFLAMNFFFWPTPSKIGQFEQKWPINWPSGIPVTTDVYFGYQNPPRLRLASL
jgi:hypothetical protein